jgi:tetratricopeptide (TPR) repeat protein
MHFTIMAKKITSVPQPKATATAQPIVNNTPKGVSLTLLSIILMVFCFVAYYNTLSNGFVYDDALVITQNKLIRQGPSAISEIFGSPRLSGYAHVNNDSYRPLSLAMFAIEYQMSDGKPGMMHFMNVLWFALSVVLLFKFLHALLQQQKPWVAFMAALLFALHPIHTEVVGNLKSRDEIMCFLFAMLAMLQFNKYMKENKHTSLAFGILALFAAYLSKETVVTFLAVIPITYFFYINDSKQRAMLITGSAVGVSLLFIGLWRMVLAAAHADQLATIDFTDNMLITAPNVATKMATAIMVLGYYIKLLVVPYPLVCDYSYKYFELVSWSSIPALLSLVAYLGMGILGVYRLLKHPKDPWAFALLFFLSTLSLFGNIAFLFSSIFGERFAYFASVGFCLLLALVIDHFIRPNKSLEEALWSNKKILMVLAPILLVYGAITIQRNSEWSDNVTLYAADVQKIPTNIRLNYSLGNEYLTRAFDQTNPQKMDDLERAKTHLRQAIAIHPKYQNALLSLGLAFYNFKETDSAKKYIEMAIKAKPDYAMAYFYLSNIYLSQHDFTNAIQLLEKAVGYEKDYLMALFNLGVCYQENKQYDKAIQRYKEIIKVNSTFNDNKVYGLLAQCYQLSGHPDSASKYQLRGK